jgi:hypothetical protein
VANGLYGRDEPRRTKGESAFYWCLTLLVLVVLALLATVLALLVTDWETVAHGWYLVFLEVIAGFAIVIAVVWLALKTLERLDTSLHFIEKRLGLETISLVIVSLGIGVSESITDLSLTTRILGGVGATALFFGGARVTRHESRSRHLGWVIMALPIAAVVFWRLKGLHGSQQFHHLSSNALFLTLFLVASIFAAILYSTVKLTARSRDSA